MEVVRRHARDGAIGSVRQETLTGQDGDRLRPVGASTADTARGRRMPHVVSVLRVRYTARQTACRLSKVRLYYSAL